MDPDNVIAEEEKESSMYTKNTFSRRTDMIISPKSSNISNMKLNQDYILEWVNLIINFNHEGAAEMSQTESTIENIARQPVDDYNKSRFMSIVDQDRTSTVRVPQLNIKIDEKGGTSSSRKMVKTNDSRNQNTSKLKTEGKAENPYAEEERFQPRSRVKVLSSLQSSEISKAIKSVKDRDVNEYLEMLCQVLRCVVLHNGTNSLAAMIAEGLNNSIPCLSGLTNPNMTESQDNAVQRNSLIEASIKI